MTALLHTITPHSGYFVIRNARYIVGALVLLTLFVGFAIPAINGRAERQRQFELASSMRQIVIALKSYTADHGGKYPATLEELVVAGLVTDKSELDGPHIPGWSKETGFEYRGATMTDDTDGNRWLLISKSHGPTGKRLVARNDGSVSTEVGPEL